MLPLGRACRYVFIGDSITDCGRRDDHDGHLGNGYVRLIRDWLLARSPGDVPTILNRGVAGDRIVDLAKRWQTDVLDAAADVVSIKIGINDVWRQIDKKDRGIPLEEYVRTYEQLLVQLVAARPKVRVVLVEPSVISPPVCGNGNQLVLPYAMAVREIARVFAANVECVVPLHGTCIEAESLRPDVPWWPDGVHPSPAGHALLARTWLAATKLL